MKESTGGMLLMGLAAGIIMIFIILVAFFISYGKSFKLKNSVINNLEQSEGMTQDQVKQLLTNGGNAYNGKTAEICYNVFNDVGGNVVGFNYEIVVYMEMDRTILGELFTPKIPIKGETKVIEKGNYFNCLKGTCVTGVTKTGTTLNGITMCPTLTSVGYA